MALNNVTEPVEFDCFKVFRIGDALERFWTLIEGFASEQLAKDAKCGERSTNKLAVIYYRFVDLLSEVDESNELKYVKEECRDMKLINFMAPNMLIRKAVMNDVIEPHSRVEKVNGKWLPERENMENNLDNILMMWNTEANKKLAELRRQEAARAARTAASAGSVASMRSTVSRLGRRLMAQTMDDTRPRNVGFVPPRVNPPPRAPLAAGDFIDFAWQDAPAAPAQQTPVQQNAHQQIAGMSFAE